MSFISDISKLKSFMILWLGQFLSSLGSSMTSFAVTIWAFQKTGSALVLSIASLFVLVPKIVGGVLAGPIVDRLSKKAVMICADLGAGLCTLALFLLLRADALQIWHIYCLNFISGMLGAFQTPANNVAVSMVVPKEYYVKTSGMQSFSSGIIQTLSPVFAAAALAWVGMPGVMLFDLATLLLACATLGLFVRIPNLGSANRGNYAVKRYIAELAEGFGVIKASGLLTRLMLFVAFLSFVSGITYFNLLSPMILARSGNDSAALALVNGAVGAGGIIGGLLTVTARNKGSKIKSMFLCCALSFFFGDLMLALGGNAYVWALAGFMSSVFLPPFDANESYFWRTIIPVELQGRAFAGKSALQNGAVATGMLLGGVLADGVFEPFMADFRGLWTRLLGEGSGSGMAMMFLITGAVGTVLSVASMLSRKLRAAEKAHEKEQALS